MIAFGSSMTDPEAYRRYARPGIELAAEHDSEVYAFAAAGSICRSYNLLLDTAATRENLDALVIVGQEVEIADPDLWIEAHIKVAEKWNGRMPGVDVGEVQWKQRARRAEAEREVARTAAYSTASRFDARVVPLERALEDMTDSLSWRITTPLRRMN